MRARQTPCGLAECLWAQSIKYNLFGVLSKLLADTRCAPGSVLGAGDTAVDETHRAEGCSSKVDIRQEVTMLEAAIHGPRESVTRDLG